MATEKQGLEVLLSRDSAKGGLLKCRRSAQQYWADDTRAYRFVPVAEFARAFEGSATGRAALAASEDKLSLPYPPNSRMDPLVRTRCAPVFKDPGSSRPVVR